jgi:hypothetical protein
MMPRRRKVCSSVASTSSSIVSETPPGAVIVTRSFRTPHITSNTPGGTTRACFAGMTKLSVKFRFERSSVYEGFWCAVTKPGERGERVVTGL